MIIQELINQLKAYPPNKEIYLSGDPEGNDIRTIDEVAKTEEENYQIIIWPTDTIID